MELQKKKNFFFSFSRLFLMFGVSSQFHVVLNAAQATGWICVLPEPSISLQAEF